MEIIEDVFRQNYIQISPEASNHIIAIKSKAQELYEMIAYPNKDGGIIYTDGRCQSLSISELESSIMWAIKGFTTLNNIKI